MCSTLSLMVDRFQLEGSNVIFYHSNNNRQTCSVWRILSADGANCTKTLETRVRITWEVSWHLHWWHNEVSISAANDQHSNLFKMITNYRWLKQVWLQHFGHITRTQNLYTCILDGRSFGRRGARSIGRLQWTWSDDIMAWTGKSMEEWTAIVLEWG